MRKYFLGALMALFFFTSCKKEIEVLNPHTLDNYFPLEVGKQITYALDSTLFLNFGKTRTVISYQAQDRIDAKITDNLGRPSYRIFRYIRKDNTKPWVFSNTFMATPTNNTIEYVENNLRYVKLKFPIRQGDTWKGNTYINTTSIDVDLRYLDDWDYEYDSVGVPLTLNSLLINNTITVKERDEFIGQDPSIPSTLYAEKNYSKEKYGKGIGLIYRECMHWEYQGQNGGSYDGYGVKLTIISHN
ncbi:MAG: hypothetical protein ABI208_03320 [Ginsengibacter sp.]